MRKQYTLTLLTIAPVSVGNGKTYTSKEYILEDGYYYFPEMYKLYNVLRQKYPTKLDEFEKFLCEPKTARKTRLIEFLQNQGITDRDFGGYKIKATGYETDRKNGILNEIKQFAKDPYGDPYIPGSSLKGALRTILENEYFKTTNISWGARAGKEFDDIFHNIRVVDSQVIDTDNLTLVQKWDYSYQKQQLKKLMIHREALKPMTEVKFEIDAVGAEAIELVEKLGQYSNQHQKRYQEKYLNLIPQKKYVQKNLKTALYLGAGSGFWSKVDMERVRLDRIGPRFGKIKMKGKGVFKLTKYYNKAKHNEKAFTLINNGENLYEMGKCIFSIERAKK